MNPACPKCKSTNVGWVMTAGSDMKWTITTEHYKCRDCGERFEVVKTSEVNK